MILPTSISVTKASDILPPPTPPPPPKAPASPAEAAAENGRAVTPTRSPVHPARTPAFDPQVRVLSRDAVVDKCDKMCATGKEAIVSSPHQRRTEGSQLMCACLG